MTDQPRSPYRVPMADLERAAHVPQDGLVAELAEDPNPGVVLEWQRRRDEFLTWGTTRGA